MFLEIAGAVLIGNLLTLVVYQIVSTFPQVIGWIIRAVVGALILGAVGLELFFLVMGFKDWSYWIVWLIITAFFMAIHWVLKKSGMLGALFGD